MTNLTNTKKAIRELPDGGYVQGIAWERGERGLIERQQVRLDSDDLKALVDRLDELERAIKRFVENGTYYNDSRGADVVYHDEFARLRKAIEEEK